MDRRIRTALVGALVAWASAFAAVKYLLDAGFAGEDLALLRYAVAVPGFAYLLVRSGGLPGLGLRDAARIAAAGLVIVAGYQLSLNLGTAHTTAGMAALVVALAPALTVLAAAALGYERLTARRTTGTAVAFAGVALVVTLGSGAAVSASDVRGPLIVLGAPVAFALYSVLLKPLFARYGAIELTAAASLVGTLGLLPLARPRTLDAVAGATPGEIGLILSLGLFSTLGAYVAWTKTLEAIGPARASVWANAVPPLAILFAAVALGETITLWFAAGGALVVGGVLLAQRTGRAARRPRLRPALAAAR